MKILEHMAQGLRQAFAARKLILVLWLVNLLAAVPATLLLSTALAESFGSSLVAESMREGFDTGWFGEFEARAKGLETTFSPTVTGPGPMLDNLEAFWSGAMFTQLPGLVALGITFALFWAFLLGGILGRLALQQTHPHRRMGLEQFAGVGGRYFVRFCGLAVLSGVLYFLVYRLGRWLVQMIKAQTENVTEERTVLLLVMTVSVLVVFLLNCVRMVFDYAKIATVLDDQSNVFKGAWAGFRMVLRHPFATLALYFTGGTLAMLLLVAYASVAPGAGPSTFLGILLAFLFGQLYLITRLTVRVGLLAGQMRLYRRVA